jgi:hypothetical protein
LIDLDFALSTPQSVFCSGSRNTVAIRLEENKEAVFLGFGVVSAQSQATAGDSTIEEMHRKADAMLPRQSLAKSQKSSLRIAT